MSLISSRLGIAAARLSHGLRRTYGSAAAAQLDYDYYHCYDGEEEPPVSEGWETPPGRGVQWVIMGDPMASRHVYAERLANLLDVPHISVGSLVRQELNPNSPLYKKIAGAVNQGKLVPEDVIFGLLSNRLEEGYCRGENGFILDGIPRTRMQAEILDKVTDIDLVLNLKCTDESVMKKTLGGRIYSPSRGLHSIASSGVNNLSPFQSSSADSDPVWKEKLHMFAVQRKPLEDYYKKQKKLLDFLVTGAPGDTWQGLLTALQLQHMSNAASSPHKLSA
ncbi:hypothetical protein CASFOL_033139 [Castilleja foliolosa]|uniref:adenylate kinase n=1 Tax=Castilleja foliolosa TaxID=1961234 RepID=A0ABD3C3H0_9LAMI